jgi:hypothetical protein
MVLYIFFSNAVTRLILRERERVGEVTGDSLSSKSSWYSNCGCAGGGVRSGCGPACNLPDTKPPQPKKEADHDSWNHLSPSHPLLLTLYNLATSAHVLLHSNSVSLYVVSVAKRSLRISIVQ